MDFKDIMNVAKGKVAEVAKNVKKEDVEKIAGQCKRELDKGDKKNAAMKLAEGVGSLLGKK